MSVSRIRQNTDGDPDLSDAEHAAAREREHGDAEDDSGGGDHTTGGARTRG